VLPAGSRRIVGDDDGTAAPGFGLGCEADDYRPGGGKKHQRLAWRSSDQIDMGMIPIDIQSRLQLGLPGRGRSDAMRLGFCPVPMRLGVARLGRNDRQAHDQGEEETGES